MTDITLILRPRPIHGTALDEAVTRHVEGWGHDPVHDSDDFFERLAVVPHALTTDGFIVDADTAIHVSSAIACGMAVDVVYLDSDGWQHRTRTASVSALQEMRIGSAADIKKFESFVRSTGRLCGRSLKRPNVCFDRPLLTLTIEPKRKKAAPSRQDDLQQAHLLDYM
jgi:hypothetical protein